MKTTSYWQTIPAWVCSSRHTRDPRRRPLLVLLTDGKATSPAGEAAGGGRSGAQRAVRDSVRAAGLLAGLGVASVVVDCEQGMVRLGLAGQLATALGGACLRLEELSADAVAGVVRAARDGVAKAA
ncbi:hypothetical protein [Saccharopolyspora sp.]|uniref:hypothetical protein n=1 Tax=Saccharopolyspora sp. TaxID=33915 RepID=UPI00345D078E